MLKRRHLLIAGAGGAAALAVDDNPLLQQILSFVEDQDEMAANRTLTVLENN